MCPSVSNRASDIASILFCAFVSCVLTILVRLAWRRTVRTIAWPAGNARFQMSATTELGQLADMEGLQMIAKSHPNEEVPRRAKFLVRPRNKETGDSHRSFSFRKRVTVPIYRIYFGYVMTRQHRNGPELGLREGSRELSRRRFSTLAIAAVATALVYSPLLLDSPLTPVRWRLLRMSCSCAFMVVVPIVLARIAPKAAGWSVDWLPRGRAQLAWLAAMPVAGPVIDFCSVRLAYTSGFGVIRLPCSAGR